MAFIAKRHPEQCGSSMHRATPLHSSGIVVLEVVDVAVKVVAEVALARDMMAAKVKIVTSNTFRTGAAPFSPFAPGRRSGESISQCKSRKRVLAPLDSLGQHCNVHGHEM